MIAVLALILAITSVTSGAAIAKGLFPAIGAQGTVALRNGFGAVMLLAFWRPWRHGALTRGQIRLILIYGGSLGLMNLLYYMALRTLPLGMAVAIEFTGPFTLALLTSRRLSDLLWLALAITGLLMLLPWGEGTMAVDPIGAAYALAAGACWAFYIVFGQRVGAQLSSGRASSLGTLVAALLTLPFGLQHAGLAMFEPSILLLGLAVALFSSAIPFSLDMVALKRLPTRTFGILMSMEPAIGAASGFFLLGETLEIRQQIAIVCVIIASFGSAASARTGLVVTPEV
jgi:inner membrane transporter RhtA